MNPREQNAPYTYLDRIDNFTKTIQKTYQVPNEKIQYEIKANRVTITFETKNHAAKNQLEKIIPARYLSHLKEAYCDLLATQHTCKITIQINLNIFTDNNQLLLAEIESNIDTFSKKTILNNQNNNYIHQKLSHDKRPFLGGTLGVLIFGAVSGCVAGAYLKDHTALMALSIIGSMIIGGLAGYYGVSKILTHYSHSHDLNESQSQLQV